MPWARRRGARFAARATRRDASSTLVPSFRLPRATSRAMVAGPSMSDLHSDISHDQHAVRRQKLAEMRAAGFDPFRANVATTHFSADAKALYVDGGTTPGGDGRRPAGDLPRAGRQLVREDSRISRARSSFTSARTCSARSATAPSREVARPRRHHRRHRRALQDEDRRITVRVDAFTLVSKGAAPLPEKFHGLHDPEIIYRQRYLDTIMNAESRARLMTRSRIVSHIRRFLEAQSFIEVETPVLENTAGGAAARPFKTHHNALNSDFYLPHRHGAAPEAHARGRLRPRLRIGRIFRNEGVSRRHNNPGVHHAEVYQAYSDYRGMMTLVRIC